MVAMRFPSHSTFVRCSLPEQPGDADNLVDTVLVNQYLDCSTDVARPDGPLLPDGGSAAAARGAGPRRQCPSCPPPVFFLAMLVYVLNCWGVSSRPCFSLT